MTRARAAILCGALAGGIASASPGYGCTILNVTEGGRTYVAANEDWSTDRFYIRVQPARVRRRARWRFERPVATR